MQTLRQLVVGTDFSEGAARALELAMQIATATAARITLVHVCELDDTGDDDRRLREYEQALAREVAKLGDRGVEVTCVLRCGRPWEKLDNVAAEVGASLIVVGRGDHDAIGSVAQRLVRCASRPVLTVANRF